MSSVLVRGDGQVDRRRLRWKRYDCCEIEGESEDAQTRASVEATFDEDAEMRCNSETCVSFSKYKRESYARVMRNWRMRAREQMCVYESERMREREPEKGSEIIRANKWCVVEGCRFLRRDVRVDHCKFSLFK